MNWKIEITPIEVIHPMTHKIEEFISPYPIEEYQKRLSGVPYLALAAYDEDKIIGFKIGYQLSTNTFYSWMGAVLKDYRGQQVAKQLAKYQESWAKENGYSKIRFKTRNKLRSMLLFAIKNDFNIVGVEPREDLNEYRIVMEKDL
jgi:ribosomal protein S18 acetylase RimI-like enzyme